MGLVLGSVQLIRALIAGGEQGGISVVMGCGGGFAGYSPWGAVLGWPLAASSRADVCSWWEMHRGVGAGGPYRVGAGWRTQFWGQHAGGCGDNVLHGQCDLGAR